MEFFLLSKHPLARKTYWCVPMEKKGAHNSLNTISHCSQKAKMKLLQLLSSIVSMVIHFGFCVTLKDEKFLLQHPVISFLQITLLMI